MDRRQKKSRRSIFDSFIELLSEKSYDKITVGEIIQRADVGRATFYAHFETKDFLLSELCGELFDHIFESASGKGDSHSHIFHCEAPDSVFLHLFQHLQKNDNNILELLSGRNNELFLGYFKDNLRQLVESQLPLFEHRRDQILPADFWADHVAATLAQTMRWWLDGGLKESPEVITEYFFRAV